VNECVIVQLGLSLYLKICINFWYRALLQQLTMSVKRK